MTRRILSMTLFGLVLLAPALAADIHSDMSTLWEEKPYNAHRASSYDRSGGNIDRFPIAPGDTLTLLDTDGPGIIQHIWCTISSPDPHHLRDLVLRIYWDGETSPSVEAPLGDFFGQGHWRYYHVESAPLMDGASRGLNCFFPMPFKSHARITVENQSTEYKVNSFYYYVDYRTDIPLPEKTYTFHAWYNQKFPADPVDDYAIVHATGEGQYVGCNLSIQLNSDGWWGEGDDKIWIDDATSPTLWGTGSEDYFCGAWGFGEVFTRPYFGVPLMTEPRQSRGALWNVYRYHILDPIPFKKNIRVDIETGASPGTNARSPFTNNYSSVGYWYQLEPHTPFPPLPAAADRISALQQYQTDPDNPVKEGERMPVRATSDAGVEVAVQSKNSGWTQLDWSGNQQAWLKFSDEGQWADLEFLVRDTREYDLTLALTKSWDYASANVYINGVTAATGIDCYNAGTVISATYTLPRMTLPAGANLLRIEAGPKNAASQGTQHYLGVDYLRAE